MAANKIVLNGEVLIDLTGDTATEADVAEGKTFHKANGESALGIAKFGGGGGDININGDLIPCRVADGASVSAGDFVELLQQWGENEVLDFNATNGIVRRVDDTRLIIGYSFDSKARARILKLENGVVTVGDEFTFTDTSTATIRALEVMGNNRVVFQLNAQYLRLLQISDMQLTQVGSIDYSSPRGTQICKHSDTMIIGSSLTKPRDYIGLISIENDTFTEVSKSNFISISGYKSSSSSTNSCKLAEDIYAFSFPYDASYRTNFIIVIIGVGGTGVTIINTLDSVDYSKDRAFSNIWSAGDGYLWCIPNYTNSTSSTDDKIILFHISGSTIEEVTRGYINSGTTSYVAARGFAGTRLILSSSTTEKWHCAEYDESLQQIVFTDGASYSEYLSTGSSYASEGTSQLLALLNQAAGTSLVQLNVSDSNVVSISDTQPSSGYDYIVQGTSSRVVPVGVADEDGTEGQIIDVYVPTENSNQS